MSALCTRRFLVERLSARCKLTCGRLIDGNVLSFGRAKENTPTAVREPHLYLLHSTSAVRSVDQAIFYSIYKNGIESEKPLND
jgi:hypothetical protein